jgi:hypothetical protein
MNGKQEITTNFGEQPFEFDVAIKLLGLELE